MCMGAPRQGQTSFDNNRVYPHVYGGTPLAFLPPYVKLGLSPCVWGHLSDEEVIVSQRGSIPMCMGAPTFRQIKFWQCGVYPHVYGGTYSGSFRLSPILGLSPCVWGHLKMIAW